MKIVNTHCFYETLPKYLLSLFRRPLTKERFLNFILTICPKLFFFHTVYADKN
jgi:hypothetical protein